MLACSTSAYESGNRMSGTVIRLTLEQRVQGLLDKVSGLLHQCQYSLLKRSALASALQSTCCSRRCFRVGSSSRVVFFFIAQAATLADVMAVQWKQTALEVGRGVSRLSSLDLQS